MLQRRIIALCTGLLIFITVHAQVNLQTGSATFSLPMFNWQDDKSRLKLDVALSYNSGNGLKVNDVASNVGQGWNMVAGGVITRMQVGEPDDQKAYDGNGKETDITKYPNGYLYSFASSGKKPADGCPLALTRYPIYGSMNQVYKQHNEIAADKQLDYFSFQFNGKAGMFVLDPNQGNVGVFLGDSKMKVSFDLADLTGQDIRTTIKAFTITDADGVIYHFEKYGTMKVLEESYCDANLVQARTQPKLDAGKSYHQAGFENANYKYPLIINSWYLTRIEDPFTSNRVITFTYNTMQVNNIAGVDISYDSWHDNSVITHKKSITTALEIASITLPDQHVVTFKYGNDRVDLTGQKVLSNVDILYQNRYLSRYLLNTSYFILNRYGTPTSWYEMAAARLCLLSVKKLGPDLKEDSPPYIFNYYMGSGGDDVVPPPFCIKHDIWGFYNGSNSKDFNGNDNIPVVGNLNTLNYSQCRGLCFLQNNASGITYGVKDRYAKNGLLRQIIYPTGGSITYEYDQNKGDLPNSPNVSIGGVHVSKTTSADGGYSNGCGANAISTQYNYILDGGASSMWGLETPVNSDAGWMHYAPEYKTYRWTIHNFPFGSCFYHFQYPGILSQNQSVDLSSFQKTMAAIAPVLDVISAISTITDVAIICSSSGFLSWAGVVLDVVSGLITVGISCLQDNTKEGTTVTYHNFDLNAASPLPTQFKRVEVIEGAGTRGKTVHKFTSEEELPLWFKDNPNFTAKQRFFPWAYGLPRFTTVYDVHGNPVRETQNDYNFPYNLFDPIYKNPPPNGVFSKLVSCKCLVTKSWSQRNTDWSDPLKYNFSDSYKVSNVDGLNVEFYPIYSGRAELATTYERVYKPNDPLNYVETRTDYTYNDGTNNYDVRSISTTQSNGDVSNRVFKYNSDLSGGIFDLLKAKNVTSLPVVTQESVSKTNGGLLNETVTEFTQLANGDIKPLRILNERTDRPVTSNNWTYYNGPNNTDYSKYHVTQSFTYDASGNLVAAIDEGGRTVANIYDYEDKYVVASVINADAVNDKPAYTSFETDNLGGWQLSGASNPVTTTAITGTRIFNLAGSSLSAPLNANKPYIVSFWANGNNVTVSGNATLVKSAPVINGYTYYEYNISSGTRTVTIGGSAYIDELRLYPQMARMRTVAYDPLIGKIAECDENNRLTYYEYDNLGRLRFIKDDNSNIVKMFEYNNVSKQNGCPGVYANQMASVTFTKACDPGYVGTDVFYTVPAGKYSSTISQQDADAQAEMELLTHGQDNADNIGHCNQLYYNIEHAQSFQTQSCGDGYEGGTVSYTVPANKYSSIVPGEADQMAQDDITANGQAYANSPDNASCHIDTSPIWEVVEGATTDCRVVDGQGHLFMLTIDVNPNSQSHGSYSWQDTGPNSSCPTGPFYSDDMSNDYRPNNCPQGWDPYPTYVSMPQGSYVSNISQQDANDKAYAAAQAIANSRNSCEGPPVYVYSDHVNDMWPNDSPSYLEVVFVSQNTGESYYFSGEDHGGIPEGTYDVYMVNNGLPHDYYLYICGFTSDSGGWIHNIYVADNNNNCNAWSIYAVIN